MFGQRAQSRLGGLSINTASANSTTTQPSLSGGLFGSSQQNKPAATSFTSPNRTSQPQQSSGLFGSLTNKPDATPGFSGQQIMGSAPQQSTSLLGGTLGSQGAPTGAQQQPSSVFGASSTQQPQTQQGGGLFGSSLQVPKSTQNNVPSQTSSLFGGIGSTKPTSSLFGNSLAPPQTQSTLSAPPQPSSIFSSSIGQMSQQHPVVPGVRVTLNELRPTTRFNDLHEELQKIIENVDNFVLQQIDYRKECEAAMGRINQQTDTIPQDTEYCKKTLEHLQQALENDAEAIAQAKSMTKSDVHDARLSWNVIDQLKMPQQFQHTGMWNTPAVVPNAATLHSDEDETEIGSRDLVGYFSKQADDLSATLNAYTHGVAEVDEYLQNLEVGIAQQIQHSRSLRGNGKIKKSAEDQVRDLAVVLREFEGGILGVAGKVGATRDHLQSVMLGS